MTGPAEFDVTWHDAVGLTGVGMILLAYFMLQTDRWSKDAAKFSLVNFVGALLILVSLFVDFNLSAMVIEIAWLGISLYGLFNCWRRTGAAPPPGGEN